ncbi:MAG: 4Fe-4S dicluster domain-containing protein [Candidatus Thorarchaeota archaeon]
MSQGTEELRIGVYVCYCGSNIAGFIDCDSVAEYAAELPDVVICRVNKFTCSEAGQTEIKKDIRDLDLNRVVVASCTPRTHEPIFRACCAEAGLNPWLFTLANIREHCSWIHMKEREKGTEKAKDIVRMYVAKARHLEPLDPQELPVTRKALVIGGGVAGMQAALDLADMGYPVTLVEKYASIGGTMAKLDKVYPTNDCSICILGPIMVKTGQHPNITVLAHSEVEAVGGYVGNFEVKVRKKARKVSLKDCTACGMCAEKCPVEVPHEWEEGLMTRKAIYMPFPQAVPAKYLIDIENCIDCGACAKVCPRNAINYDEQDELIEDKFGTIIVATGFKNYIPPPGNRYGYGIYDDVLTTVELERLTNAAGPTGGKLVRISDMKQPKSVVFILCVGSRSETGEEGAVSWCNSYCCMATQKLAQLMKEKYTIDITICYMDIRAPFRGYEEYYNRSRHNFGLKFLRGKPNRVSKNPDGTLRVRVENTLEGRMTNLDVDMVVLVVGAQPHESYGALQKILTAPLHKDGFFMEGHPQLAPVDTTIAGVFIAGFAQGPKDIMMSVGQGSAAAARAARLLTTGRVEIEPITAVVDQERCVGCRECLDLCPYGAIKFDEEKKKAYIIDALCKGCGCCVAHCLPGAIQQHHFTNADLLAEIDAFGEELSF